MSDLAPFVAAAIRDKVVCDLQAENEVLRRQLREMRRIELTAGDYGPVYAKGHLNEDGDFCMNPNLFEVKLKTNSNVPMCKLSDLPQVQVQLGGILRTSFNDDEYVFDVIQCDVDKENGTKVFDFCFSNNYWISVVVHNWPMTEEEVDDDDWASEEAMNYLEDIANMRPDTYVTFEQISFFAREYRSYIDQIPLSEQKVHNLEERRQDYELDGLIMSRMRRMGNNHKAEILVHQANEIHDVLIRVGINRAGDELESLLGPLIKLQVTHDIHFQGFMDQVIEGLEQLGPDVGFADVIHEFDMITHQQEEDLNDEEEE